MQSKEQINKQLNRLLNINYKAELAFIEVIDNVENTVIKNFLRVSGYERKQFIKKIDSAIRQIGGIPTYPDTSLIKSNIITASFNKTVLKSNKLKILNEIGKMQVTDIEKYQKILNNFDFPEQIENSLRKQKDAIIHSLYGIEVHKDLFARNQLV